VHELVIVLSDLYVSQEAPERELPLGIALPGLQQVARFGSSSSLAAAGGIAAEGGWRGWLARWLTGAESRPAAVVAAATLAAPNREVVPAATATQPSAVWMATPNTEVVPAATATQPSTVWMATPVHLLAGLTSVHLDRRSILRLEPHDQSPLAADFERVFHDSGFELRALDSGDFLLFGPRAPIVETLEPARAMGASIVDAQRVDAKNPALRRLGGEIEMWLHDHAVNDVRRRRGELPVTGMWMWGGGTLAGVAPAAAGANHSTDIAFGRDSFLQGLWAARGEKVFPLPGQLADVFGYPQARRAVLLIEVGSMLQSNPTWTFFDAVAHIDRNFTAPAVEALNRGRFGRLTVLANDHQLTLRARDRFKLWRRAAPGLSGLQ
jgi:hypothetical protein